MEEVGETWEIRSGTTARKDRSGGRCMGYSYYLWIRKRRRFGNPTERWVAVPRGGEEEEYDQLLLSKSECTNK